jgi:exopolyphosphatase / guanosine-5'-triphosphate,3'-diphosphate pyrophosphatase
MTPERPHRADATDATVETPMEVSRADKPSALSDPGPDLGTAPLYAALDLGTNSCRMLIAQPKGSQFQVVDSFSKTVQLGVGLEASGGSAARRWGGRCRRCGSAPRRSTATVCAGCGLSRPRPAAARATPATSSARCGAKPAALEIIAPEEEARLGRHLLRAAGEHATEQLLVVDIGGGSTELVWIDLSAVPPPERPRAIMRLHTGFGAQGEGPVARVVDWIRAAGGGHAARPVRRRRRRCRTLCPDELVLRREPGEFRPANSENRARGVPDHRHLGTVTTVAASFLNLRAMTVPRLTGCR